MKNTFLSILVSIIVCCSQQGVAQGNDINERAKEITERQTKQLSLSPEQVPKVEAINLDFIAATQQVKEDGGSKLSKFKSFKKLDETRTESMKTILTDEQFKAFEKVKKENRKELKTRYKKSK